MMKKLGSIAVAVSMITGTVATDLGAIASAAAAPTAVAALGLGTMLAPSAAHAQSGSRVCAMRFGSANFGVRFYLYLEVNKSDIFTCAGATAAFEAMLGTSTLASAVGTAISYGLGPLTYNAVCEKFSSTVRWRDSDICNWTERYRMYVVVMDGTTRLARL